MSEEAGGAAPRRGFRYQDLAAAYYFITDYPDMSSSPPEHLYIERYDSDFAFIMEDEGKTQHFFEVKHIKSGELKWGEKFKKEVFPEFYRISEKYAASGPKDRSFYHLVTNGAVASRINDFVEDAETIRHGTRWGVFKARDGRTELQPLLSGVRANDPVNNDEDVEIPDSKDDLYGPTWGLMVHTPTAAELESKLENYLRRCSPANFRAPMATILDKISATDSGVIHRRDLEELTGISLDAESQSTSSANAKSMEEVRGSVEDISQSYSSASPNVPQIRQEREEVREFGERIEEHPETDDIAVESAREIVDEQFEELERLEREKSATEAQIGQQVDILLNQADSTSSGPEDHD